MDGEIKDECAVAAVSLPETVDKYPNGAAAFYLYQMLLRMQNRGELAAGITTYGPERQQIIDTHKKLGTVSEVFSTHSTQDFQNIMTKYAGVRGIGHTRYSTSGGNDVGSAQPFERHHGKKWKWFSFCFNGNIANFTELKADIEKKHYELVRNIDTEVILYFLEKAQGPRQAPMDEVFNGLTEKFDGAYNIAYVDAEGTLAVMRDPLGIRPMSYAIDDNFAGAAAESVALASLVNNEVKDLKPGEMFISKDGQTEIKRYAKSPRNAHCMFEYVYFSNAASVLDGRSVYETRWKLGTELAKHETLKINDKDFVVVPVPDTAKPAADAYAHALGLPSMEGLLRNRWYMGRTFIENGDRMELVKQKFNINKVAIKGKKVILVDDSVVRGTTAKVLVQYLRNSGMVKEIHMRVTCPPIRSPCFYGIDMSTVGELIANRHSTKEQLEATGWYDLDDSVIEKIGREIGVDSISYMKLDGLVKSIGLTNGKKDMCTACLTGEYPTGCGAKLREKAVQRYEQHKEGTRTYE